MDDDARSSHGSDPFRTRLAGEFSRLDHPQTGIGTETIERKRDISIIDQVQSELADVERAMRRLEAGTYGTCEACGGPIDEARLEAEPAARLCLVDEQMAESQSRDVGRR